MWELYNGIHIQGSVADPLRPKIYSLLSKPTSHPGYLPGYQNFPSTGWFAVALGDQAENWKYTGKLIFFYGRYHFQSTMLLVKVENEETVIF